MMQFWRCSKCDRKLARLSLEAGTVEIQCRNCATLNTITVKRLTRVPVPA